LSFSYLEIVGRIAAVYLFHSAGYGFENTEITPSPPEAMIASV